MLCAWRMRKHMDALAGMLLARLFLGEMECSIAVNCFPFKVAEKVLYLFFIQEYSGFPTSSFATWELSPSCTPHMLYPTYHEMLRWSTKHLSKTNKQLKNPQDFQIANLSSWQGTEYLPGSEGLCLRACVCHKVMSSKVRPFSTTLVPGRFLSASSSGVSILKSPSWGYYLSVYIINLSTCSAPAHLVKSRKTKLRYARSAVFKTLALGQYGYLCQENEGKVPELWW